MFDPNDRDDSDHCGCKGYGHQCEAHRVEAEQRAAEERQQLADRIDNNRPHVARTRQAMRHLRAARRLMSFDELSAMSIDQALSELSLILAATETGIDHQYTGDEVARILNGQWQ